MTETVTTKGTQIDNDKKLLQYDTYEEYLDSLVSAVDLFYLRNTETARRIAELGYKTTGETLTREDYHKRKNIVKNLLFPPWKPFTLDSELCVSKEPLIIELSLRERLNRLGLLSTIVFIRILTKLHHEISGFIDFAHRLCRENWKAFFQGKKRLKPQPTDLSYYHWKIKKSLINKSDNYEPIVEVKKGMRLKNLKDLKFIDLDPEKSPGIDTFRLRVDSDYYQQVVIYDHIVRNRI